MTGLQIARWLAVSGLVLLAAAGLIFAAVKLDLPLGKLPGDLVIKRENLTIRFPLASSILLSIGLTLIINVLVWIFRR